jgi:signal transduction histidine kinase
VPLDPRDHSAIDAELAALRAEVARLREDRKCDEQLVRELGDAVAARDAFLAVAAHELRNPMSGIMLAATNLGHLAKHSTDPAHTWLPSRVALLERQARRFVRRATMLLDVSRLTSGQLRLDPELVDLTHATQETVDELAVEAERSKCAFHVDAPEPVVGFWDRMAIEQVAWNLVSNAIKYGAGKPVSVTVSSDGTSATLTVADSGIGISPADRERIFAPFERAVTQRTHNGFGLGLWIVRQLVHASGGTIGVESEPGAGSIFTVELPQAVERIPQ